MAIKKTGHFVILCKGARGLESKKSVGHTVTVVTVTVFTEEGDRFNDVDGGVRPGMRRDSG